MTYLSIFIILASGVIHATWNFFAKRSKDKLTFLYLAKILQSLLYLPLALLILKKNPIPLYGWYAIILSGIIHSFYWIFLSNALTFGDLSLVYPIARSAPALIPIPAFFLFKERLTAFGIIGITIVLLGVYFISINSFNLGNLLKRIFLIEDRGVLFSFLTLISVTFYSLTDKFGAKFVHPILYVYFFELISLLILSFVVVFRKRGLTKMKYEWKENKLHIILVGITIILSYSLIILVMRVAPVSYIVAVREVGIIFGVILGIFVLKEKYGKVRFISSVLIFLGIVLIGILG